LRNKLKLILCRLSFRTCGVHGTDFKDYSLQKVSEIARQNRRLSIRAVAELINIDKETVRRILRNNLNMKIVCSKMVPRPLTPEQKEIRMNVSADILQNIKNDPNLLENLITCYESWFFNATQKVGANPSLEVSPFHQGKRKHGRANPN